MKYSKLPKLHREAFTENRKTRVSQLRIVPGEKINSFRMDYLVTNRVNIFRVFIDWEREHNSWIIDEEAIFPEYKVATAADPL